MEGQFSDADEDDNAVVVTTVPVDNEDDVDDDEEEEDVGGDFGEWSEEEAGDEVKVASLFEPDRVFGSVEEALTHDAALGLDAEAFKALSVYDRIKLVNYVRTQVKEVVGPWSQSAMDGPEQLLVEVKQSSGLPDGSLWEADTYLMPVLREDLYLTWADDEHFEEDEAGQHQLEDQIVNDARDKELEHELEELREKVNLDELQ